VVSRDHVVLLSVGIQKSNTFARLRSDNSGSQKTSPFAYFRCLGSWIGGLLALVSAGNHWFIFCTCLLTWRKGAIILTP
jgi:hypothetical protein